MKKLLLKSILTSLLLLAFALPAGRAGASTVSVCNFPSGSAAEVRVYDLTAGAQITNWTNTGVSERAVALSTSCYDYTVALTAGHAYQIDWEDGAAPTKVASETLCENQTAVAAIPTNPLLTTDTRLNNLNAPVGSIPTNPLLTTDSRLNYLDAAVSSRATQSAVTTLQTSVNAVPTNPLMTTDPRLNYLDANISSRLAASAYTAPDNARIGLINGVTGKLQFDSSGNVKSDPQTQLQVQASISSADEQNIINGIVIQLTGSLTPGAYPAEMTVKSGQPMNIFRGDSPTININLPAGWNLQSPSGQAVWFAVKVAPADPDSSAIVNAQATITGPQTATITLTGAQTATVGRYWAEFSVVDANGNKLVAQQFKLNILQDVRQ